MSKSWTLCCGRNGKVITRENVLLVDCKNHWYYSLFLKSYKITRTRKSTLLRAFSAIFAFGELNLLRKLNCLRAAKGEYNLAAAKQQFRYKVISLCGLPQNLADI
jgi:hypothetical protein